MIRNAILAVAALPLFSTGAAVPLVGPPPICFPIEIGEAPSLPFGKGAFTVREDFDLAKAVEATVEILDQSKSPLVHMETLRRCVIYFMDSKRVKKLNHDPRALRASLVSKLRERVLDAESNPERLRAAARSLRWLDLGFTMAALHFTNYEVGGKLEHYLGRAGRLQPRNAETQFALMLGSYSRRGSKLWRPAFTRLLELCKDEESLAMQNARAFAERFLNVKTVRKLRKRFAPKAPGKD